MNLPPSIALTVTCPGNTAPSGLIFGMRVAAGTKNPYKIYFPMTDAQGRTSLSASEVVGQFKDHWEEALMDYNGSIEAAPQTAVFYLFDASGMKANHSQLAKWPLLSHERKKWKSRHEMIEYFLSCSNGRYRFKEQEVTVPPDGALAFEVTEQ